MRFIHTADLHFGMENYGHIDPATGIHTRLLDFHTAFSACVERALAEEVDFFVFAGDAYKTAHPSPTQQRLLMQSLLRLFRAEIPVIMVIGNHDNALSFGKAHALEIFGQIPVTGFHVIARPTVLHLMTTSGPVSIVGIPWPSRANIALQSTGHTSAELTDGMSNAVTQFIARAAQQLDPAIPAVLVGHLTVSSGIFSGSEKRAIYGSDPLFLPSQLAIPPFDYVALGHLHRYQNLNPQGYPAVVYSGSIERIDFGERKEEKGFCLVTIPRKGHAVHAFVTVPIRPFVQIELVLSDALLAEGVSYTQQIAACIKQHDIKTAIVKILYHIPAGARDTVDKAALQIQCHEAQYIAGIIPVRHEMVRRPRIEQISVDMSFEALLQAYFKNKPEQSAHKDRVIAKAHALLAEYEAGKRSKEL